MSDSDDEYFNTMYRQAEKQRRTVSRISHIAIIIILLIGGGIIAFLVWYLFFKKQQSSAGDSSGNNGSNNQNNNDTIPCTFSSECPSGQKCINNVCTTAECTNSAECGTFMTCDSNNNCVTQGGDVCSSNINCPTGYGCQQDILQCKGLLNTGCKADSECIFPYVCKNGSCFYKTCSSNLDCPNPAVGTLCYNSACREVYGSYCAEAQQCVGSAVSPIQGPLTGQITCGGPDDANGGPSSKCLYDDGTFGCNNDNQCATDFCQFGICN